MKRLIKPTAFALLAEAAVFVLFYELGGSMGILNTSGTIPVTDIPIGIGWGLVLAIPTFLYFFPGGRFRRSDGN